VAARKRDPKPIGEVLASFLQQSGLAERVEQAAIIPDWVSLVGEQIAQVTAPLSISRDGTLFVAVRTNAWMTELSLMEPQLLRAINAKPGRSRVQRIHWRLMRDDDSGRGPGGRRPR
jgi:predicted nucleic acid-binding Zn ribbon protein